MDDFTTTPESYLPSWVVKMRSKINESREAHAQTEVRINCLSSATADLNSTLSQLLPKMNNNQSNDVVDATQPIRAIVQKQCILYSIPMDLLHDILSNLFIEETLLLISSSKRFRVIPDNDFIWMHYFLQHCAISLESFYIWQAKNSNRLFIPSFRRAHSTKLTANPLFATGASQISAKLAYAYLQSKQLNIREVVSNHAKQSRRCLSFIRFMKDNRGSQRHNHVAPRVYSNRDSTITHPLPLFEASSPSNQRMSSTSSAMSVNSSRIMSRAETFSSDHRQIANSAMDAMFRITRNPLDTLHLRLFLEGSITVLIALLSNEAGSIQQLSCGTLANMLCWEALLRSRSITAFCGEEFNSVSGQITACNGHKVLCNLLTSPSAKINLASKKSDISNGTLEIRTTASVQGMAMKESSRALVNLFHPQDCIPAPYQPEDLETDMVLEAGENKPKAASNIPTTATNAAASEISVVMPIENRMQESGSQHEASEMEAPQTPAPVNCSAAVAGIKKRASLRAVKVASSTSMRSSANVAVSSSSSSSNPRAILPPVHSDNRKQHSNRKKSQSVSVKEVASKESAGASSQIVEGSKRATEAAYVADRLTTVESDEPTVEIRPNIEISPRFPIYKKYPIGELFVVDRVSRAWVFSYFHKSGNIKDQFIAYLRFNTEGTHMYGRGQNKEGVFVIYGKVEVTIIGYVWMISIAYVPTALIFNSLRISVQQWIVLNVGPLEFTENTLTPLAIDAEEGVILEEYFESNDELVTAAFSAMNSGDVRRRTSMVHTAYWSDGMMSEQPKNTCTTRDGGPLNLSSLSLEDLKFNELIKASVDSCGVWGLGLWGVWEMAESGSHYELQKGGVFRATPLVFN